MKYIFVFFVFFFPITILFGQKIDLRTFSKEGLIIAKSDKVKKSSQAYLILHDQMHYGILGKDLNEFEIIKRVDSIDSNLKTYFSKRNIDSFSKIVSNRFLNGGIDEYYEFVMIGVGGSAIQILEIFYQVQPTQYFKGEYILLHDCIQKVLLIRP